MIKIKKTANIIEKRESHNGMAFKVDYQTLGIKGDPNLAVRELLIEFFNMFKGQLVYHGSTFDLKILIHELYMDDPLDQAGLIKGLHIMCRDVDDTKIITYLATNNTAKNTLGLKEIAHIFAGNYAKEDIKDITLIDPQELLEYNLVDCLSTWFVYETNRPLMVKDSQLEIHDEIFIPSLKVIIQMELTGMPMVAERVQSAKKEMTKILNKYTKIVMDSNLVRGYELDLRKEKMVKANAKLKKKVHPLSHFDKEQFNPNSGDQVGNLLHKHIGLPIEDKTPTGKPATGNDQLEKMIHVTKDPAVKALIEALMGITAVSKILSTFITAFEKGIVKADGRIYLHGNFNLGGTVSMRMSSSKPNLQQIPSTGSIYATIIKYCFVAADGWLMAGADFTGLEAMIQALLTKDPNMLKIYLDGFDAHSTRALAFFPEKLPADLDANDPDSVNRIATEFPDVRQEAKSPYFLLQYQGMWIGLMKQFGFSEEKAKEIDNNYHELYTVSDDWVADKLEEATKKGYVDLAFGGRLRTPLLSQVILGTRTTPYEAQAEGRTAGNAISQCYGLLTNRAANEFMQRVWDSDYVLDIKPIAMIHDAIYLIFRDDIKVAKWVNDNLIDCMEWQDLPEIQHDTVKLGASLEIYPYGWNKKVTIKNKASEEAILASCKGYKR